MVGGIQAAFGSVSAGLARLAQGDPVGLCVPRHRHRRDGGQQRDDSEPGPRRHLASSSELHRCNLTLVVRRVVLTLVISVTQVHFCPYTPTSDFLPQTSRRRPVHRDPRDRRTRDDRCPGLRHRDHPVRRLHRVRQARHVRRRLLQGQRDDVLADVLRPQLHQLRGVPDGQERPAQLAPLVRRRQRHLLGHLDEVDHQRHPDASGSVAWWKAGVYPAGSAGHVAYVEKVVSADEIIVSMDSWRGDFSWARITRASQGLAQRLRPLQRRAARQHDAARRHRHRRRSASTLTASAGSWSVTGATYAYQWLADGARDQRCHQQHPHALTQR